VSPALYLIDTSGLFRILQEKLRQAWTDQLTAGVIAVCPVVELESCSRALGCLAFGFPVQQCGWTHVAPSLGNGGAIPDVICNVGCHARPGRGAR
jgi:hypothetical protein